MPNQMKIRSHAVKTILILLAVTAAGAFLLVHFHPRVPQLDQISVEAPADAGNGCTAGWWVSPAAYVYYVTKQSAHHPTAGYYAYDRRTSSDMLMRACTRRFSALHVKSADVGPDARWMWGRTDVGVAGGTLDGRKTFVWKEPKLPSGAETDCKTCGPSRLVRLTGIFARFGGDATRLGYRVASNPNSRRSDSTVSGTISARRARSNAAVGRSALHGERRRCAVSNKLLSSAAAMRYRSDPSFRSWMSRTSRSSSSEP
jgi:hypothetical protein